MEIYKDSNDRKIFLDVPLTPQPSTLEVDIVVDDEVVASIPTVNVETAGSSYSIVVPFAVIDNYEEFTVDWSFEYLESSVAYDFQRSLPVEVITPFLSIPEIKAIMGAETTDEDALAAERLVRTIIWCHCGQKFNRSHKTYRVRGNGRNTIQLPNKLLKLETFGGFEFLPPNFRVSGDGWYIRGGYYGVPGIKADYDGFHQINGRVYNEFGIIPQWFREENEYPITGYWGWETVPTEVKEAAKLLINDYACDDSIYRDRYIDAVSAIDWRIQFNSGAFAKTGNVKADHLLAKFVLTNGWAVL